MKDKVEKFLETKSKEINELAGDYPEKKSLVIDYQELHRYDIKLSEELKSNPEGVISIFEKVLNTLGKPTISDTEENRDREGEEEPGFRIRFANLPKDDKNSIMVRQITSDYISKLISVEGVVNKISDVLPKVYKGAFICNTCEYKNVEIQPKSQLIFPIRCENPEKSKECRGGFRFVPEESKFIDIQRLEIQESLEMLKGGEEARKIEIWAEDDLTDVVTAGDKIAVTGVVRLKPPKQRGSVYYKFVEANFIERIETEFEDIIITEEEEEEIKKLARDPRIYEMIVNSIAPSIYGYNEIKEAIALQLFSGRPGKTLPDGTKVRPDMHLLLIGDPGIAKSRILQYVDQIAPKSIYVTGKGTTGAGLTATAERDEFAEGAWTLKAGALVLAGGGIACIDEFDKMDKEDRGAMHEAMEQQTISVAKAGIVTKFKANTSILAASNPKFSRFDTYKPLAEQFDIPPTLMSRFDLIFPIRDILDKETDRKIAEHMLKMHKTEKEMEDIGPEIPTELFRKYIAYSRSNIYPVLTDDAAEKVKEYYVALRSRGKGGTASATPRQLEALVRLSEASAKIRLSDVVSIGDVDRAITLTEFVLKELTYDEISGEFDIDRIVTEHPKSVRDMIRVVEDIIRNLVEESESRMAAKEDIVNRAGEKNVDKFKVEQVLDELKKKGDIYEPRTGRFMFTEE